MPDSWYALRRFANFSYNIFVNFRIKLLKRMALPLSQIYEYASVIFLRFREYEGNAGKHGAVERYPRDASPKK